MKKEQLKITFEQDRTMTLDIIKMFSMKRTLKVLKSSKFKKLN